MHTDSKAALRRYLNERFGEKYIEFMQDLSNIALTGKQISEKWHVSYQALARWIGILGYSRDFKAKQQLRGYYRVAARVRERQEKTEKLMSFLANLSKA
jgi:hypothetical protein